MIVKLLLSLVFKIVAFILSLVGSFLSFPEGFMTSVMNYVDLLISNGAGLLFFIVRYQTVMVALDVLFFIWTAVPLYHFVMWVLRKVPFLNIE